MKETRNAFKDFFLTLYVNTYPSMEYTIEGAIKEVENYIRQSMSIDRYTHSLRVKETIIMLANKFSKDQIDKKKAELVALAHDILKEMGSDDMRLFIKENKIPFVHTIEKNNVNLMHGKAAAMLLKNRFGIKDKDVFDAIYNHVLGAYPLCKLGKALFVADYTEPGRTHVSQEFRNSIYTSRSIHEAFLKVLEHSIGTYDSDWTKTIYKKHKENVGG